MVALELDKVLVTLVGLVEVLAVLWLDEIVFGGSRKQSWNERVLYVVNW